jgi:hypothetical protein
MDIKELETVAFHRKHVLKRPSISDLLTLEDADEYKLPAMDKLLRKMAEFHSELSSVGLKLQVDINDQYPNENLYELTDSAYEHFPRFKIRVKSNWLNPKWKIAIHGGFEFSLHVVQDGYQGRYEIADWITLHICHFDTTPMSFVSSREHVKTLGAFLKDPKDAYFRDIPMSYATSCWGTRRGMTFKTEAFNEVAEDACKVMQKIISRKQYLKIFTE